MQNDDFIISYMAKWLKLRPELRIVLRRLTLIGLSFCAGLAVFYLPERPYSSVSEVWLPVSAKGEKDALNLPVRTRHGSYPGVLFISAYPDGPEIMELSARRAKVKASDCPDVYRSGVKKTGCRVIGTVRSSKVFVAVGERPTMNTSAYTMRGDTLIAIRGVYSKKEVLGYLDSFERVARRDVSSALASNKERAEQVSTIISAEKRAEIRDATEAYTHVPFEPWLPVVLPAGWVQYSVRIDGNDPRHPEGVEVLYKKGSDRFIGYSMRPKAAFSLGAQCGPTPNEAAVMVPCNAVGGEDYYTGGVNGQDYLSWYLYRPVADMVAIFYVSAHGLEGRPLALSNEDLEAQRLIAKSLRPASKDRLKGAVFSGSAQDPYPYIKP